MTASEEGLDHVRRLIEQIIDATSALSTICPRGSDARVDLREAVADLHRARGAVGREARNATADHAAGLPAEVRLTAAAGAWRIVALELLGPEQAALATYRLADGLVTNP